MSDGLIIEGIFEDIDVSSKLITTVHKALVICDNFLPDLDFIILKINGIMLRVDKDSHVNDLKDELKKRIELLEEGRHRTLQKYYNREGICR